MAALLES